MAEKLTNEKISTGTIVKVAGPLITASGMGESQMYDVVRVSDKHLVGEIIELRGDVASVQVYEDTSGIGPGEPVFTTGEPLSVELGPGIMGMIFDGIQRPLSSIYEIEGDRISRGVEVPSLDRKKVWNFNPTAKIGDLLSGGDIIGTVEETPAVIHKIMVPIGEEGVLEWLHSGEATVEQPIARIILPDGSKKELNMIQKWPVRKGRPYIEKFAPDEPMLTGQRSIDALFPIAKGGVGAIPGPFGSGKTVVQQQLAKWADADIVVYIGCGERGNEMTDVLMEFPELKDPRTGTSLMNRTVLIANTSDMPVAAREASIYTGITIAEYFRDMGYKVTVLADSTSRWAEALREMSGRLEEMPGEEGYPAYLSSRISEFYERAGYVKCLSSNGDRMGAISAIGAVSPPGGDTSEPVSQATLRIVKVFWGLSYSLAHARHFPAIDWLQSYSLYKDTLFKWFDQNVDSDWSRLVRTTMSILQEESELEEIVRLVGIDALGRNERLLLECARSLREDFLQQNAYNEVDTYNSSNKQAKMLKTIIMWYEKAKSALDADVAFSRISDMSIRESIARMKFVPEDEFDVSFNRIIEEMDEEFASMRNEGEEAYA